MSWTIERNSRLDPKELNALLTTHGWSVTPEERLTNSMAHLWGWVAARDENGFLCGFVGILSDGLRHAYIHRMIVHPAHRGHGVGRAMMEEILSWLEDEGFLPTLVAVPGSVEFYKKFGFESISHGYTAMCIRKGN